MTYDNHFDCKHRISELEAAIGRKDQAANVMANLTDKVQDRNEVLERERDAANRRADSNYAAFEQVTKIAEGLREHLRKMLDALSANKANSLATYLDLATIFRYDVGSLRAYSQIARDAQASLSGAEDPKP